MGQIKNIKLHIVTDIKKMLRQCTRRLGSLAVSNIRQCQHNTQVVSKVLSTSNVKQQHLSTSPAWYHVLQRAYSTTSNAEVIANNADATVNYENSDTGVITENADTAVITESADAEINTQSADAKGHLESEEKLVVEEKAVKEVLSEVELSRAENIRQQELRMNKILIYGLDTTTTTDEVREQVV